MNIEKIGEFIFRKRKTAGLSAKKLGDRAKVSDAYILFIEKGKRNPTFDVVARLLSALKVDWDEFLTATGYKKFAAHDNQRSGN